MPHDALLLAFVAAPFLALTILRINAAFVFLSLCLGYVLVQFVTNDASSLESIFAARVSSIGASATELLLLFAPAVLTAVFMLFSIHGRVRALLNALPAAAVALFATLLAVPLLAPGLRKTLEGQAAWRQLVRAESGVIILGAVMSLLFLWAARRKQKVVDEARPKRR